MFSEFFPLLKPAGGEGCAVAYKINCNSGLEAGLDLQYGFVMLWLSDQAVCSTCLLSRYGHWSTVKPCSFSHACSAFAAQLLLAVLTPERQGTDKEDPDLLPLKGFHPH